MFVWLTTAMLCPVPSVPAFEKDWFCENRSANHSARHTKSRFCQNMRKSGLNSLVAFDREKVPQAMDVGAATRCRLRDRRQSGRNLRVARVGPVLLTVD